MTVELRSETDARPSQPSLLTTGAILTGVNLHIVMKC